MNTWNESDWFKTWLALARHGQNTGERAQAIANDAPPHERLAIKPVGNVESVPSTELQVTE